MVKWMESWLTVTKQAVLVLKYVINDYPFPTLYFGVANVVANGLIMLRYSPSYIVGRQANSKYKFRGAMGFAKHGGRLYLQPFAVICGFGWEQVYILDAADLHHGVRKSFQHG